jgi:hypothetical protein
LKLSLLFLGILSLCAAAYFSYVQGLLYGLPDFTAPLNSRASSLDSQDPALKLIPQADDWKDYGPILEAGSEGEWDFLFAGITPASLVKKDGVYYLYYVGADGHRSFDGGPRHRSVGVATSEDGIIYQKYSRNPIVTHSPHNGQEEGANSAGLTLDSQGNFIMYYGGAFGEWDLINANGRLAVSEDGFNFTDRGIVLDRLNPFLYGFGDEIFPVAAFEHNGRWNVYYQPNGAPLNNRNLGIAWGNRVNRLPRSIGVLDERSGGKPVITWGNINWLGPDKIALFIQRLWWPDTYLEVRTASPDIPYRLSDPIVRYDIPNLKHGTVLLDSDRRTWFMIYNDFSRFWRLKLAPAGDPDESPPTKPADLKAEAFAHDSIQLSWEPASDPETGVVIYKIYRDGQEIGTTIERSFTDTGLSEHSQYTYEISAVNFHGYEGQRETISVDPPADKTPPQLVSASTHGNPTELILVFNEPVEKNSAEDVANYTIIPDGQVISASLGSHGNTVTLVTSPHSDGILYAVSGSGISDLARRPNTLSEATLLQYTHSQIKGLAGRWGMGEGSDDLAIDLSGYGNDGVILGSKWEEGAHKGTHNGALRFDGEDDYVLIEDSPPLESLTDRSFTFSAWALPEDRPEGNPYAILTRVDSHPAYYFGLSYDREGKYRAQMITGDEVFHILTSIPFEPGTWHHLAMVMDLDSNRLYLYVDGDLVEDSPRKISGTLMSIGKNVGDNYSSGEYYIGSTKPDLGAGTFFTQQFKGLIEDARIYNRALDAQEVKCLAALSCPP